MTHCGLCLDAYADNMQTFYQTQIKTQTENQQKYLTENHRVGWTNNYNHNTHQTVSVEPVPSPGNSGSQNQLLHNNQQQYMLPLCNEARNEAISRSNSRQRQQLALPAGHAHETYYTPGQGQYENQARTQAESRSSQKRRSNEEDDRKRRKRRRKAAQLEKDTEGLIALQGGHIY